MTNYMTQLNKVKCPSELLNQPLATLKELFKETDKKENTDDIYTVRGWIMEALEAKMTEAEFDRWMDAQ